MALTLISKTAHWRFHENNILLGAKLVTALGTNHKHITDVFTCIKKIYYYDNAYYNVIYGTCSWILHVSHITMWCKQQKINSAAHYRI